MSNDPKDWKQVGVNEFPQGPGTYPDMMQRQNYIDATERRMREIAREELRKEAQFTRGNAMATEMTDVKVLTNGNLSVTMSMGFGNVTHEIRAPIVQEAITRLLEIQPNLSDIIARALQMRMKE